MTEQEIKGVKQSMSDGYFHKNHTRPKESEVKACIEFFEAMGADEIAINLLSMVVDRDVLISGFDMDKREPRFIRNNIRTQ